MSSVQELNKRKLITATPEMTVERVSELMQTNNIRHIPVVEAGVGVGIISDRDVIRSLTHQGEEVAKAKDIMTASPITCDVHAEMEDLAATMIHHRIDSILIQQRGKLSGIVTSIDLLKYFCSQQLAQGRIATIIGR